MNTFPSWYAMGKEIKMGAEKDRFKLESVM